MENINPAVALKQIICDLIDAGDSETVDLFWVSVMYALPKSGRVLIYSPSYPPDDPMRFRIVDSEFVKACSEATHWSPLIPPPRSC